MSPGSFISLNATRRNPRCLSFTERLWLLAAAKLRSDNTVWSELWTFCQTTIALLRLLSGPVGKQPDTV
jgi:hypothetical protein